MCTLFVPSLAIYHVDVLIYKWVSHKPSTIVVWVEQGTYIFCIKAITLRYIIKCLCYKLLLINPLDH